MVVQLSEDIDDIFDEIKKYFKLNSNLFDMDFFIFPESDKDPSITGKKGFKVSYHYDSNSDKPEIKIEGDIDEKKLREYLKAHKIKPNSKFNKIFKSNNNNEIDAIELSLDPCETTDKECIVEPFTEINDAAEHYEIIYEVPGVEKDNIMLSFDDKEQSVLFSTKNKRRNYQKYNSLPFKPSIKEYILEANNGIATLRFKK